MKRIVLAYSGSLATSAAVAWLVQQHESEIVTVTLDFGQERELSAVRERALALGAMRAHVIDVREEFVRDYMMPALQAGVLMEGHGLVRPLIAKRLVDVARMEAASAVAHGGRLGSASEAALHAETKALDPVLDVIAPARLWRMADAELVALARARGAHVPPPDRPRTDASLWGRLMTPEPSAVVPEDAFRLTRSPDECPGDPALVEIEFAAGVPVRANGVEMSMIELIESLETIAGAHGVGRGQSGDAVIEAPAAGVLDVAHRELETFVLGADLARLKAQLSRVYSQALLEGRWFSDVREAVDAFVRVIQPRVTGTIRLELLKGRCAVLHCRSANVADAAAVPARGRKVVA
ncbi:MAG TPA: argininosuccinate synthase domain-containing protein [Vicinamibacterales bacterium]|nr:argininosuccinate synthase domain-containing protein [Vicinamibacterales bacterium]